jgi:hypothetical protein
MTQAGVIHSGENLSNHSAIYVKINVGQLDLKLEENTPQIRTCWAKANEEAKENFQSTLANKLNEIPQHEFVNCQDVHCQSETHGEGIEEYTMKILEAMESAGHECLPTSGGGGMMGKKPKIPGWSELNMLNLMRMKAISGTRHGCQLVNHWLEISL